MIRLPSGLSRRPPPWTRSGTGPSGRAPPTPRSDGSAFSPSPSVRLAAKRPGSLPVTVRPTPSQAARGEGSSRASTGWLEPLLGGASQHTPYNRGAGEGRCPFEPRQRPPRGCCAPLRTLGQGWTRALPRPSRCDARPTSTSTPGDTLPSPSDSPTRGYSPALNTVDKWWGVPCGYKGLARGDAWPPLRSPPKTAPGGRGTGHSLTQPGPSGFLKTALVRLARFEHGRRMARLTRPSRPAMPTRPAQPGRLDPRS